MSDKVINGNLIHYTLFDGTEMSAIMQNGQIVKACPKEFEKDCVSIWNHEQRQIQKRRRAKSFNDANTVYLRTNLNRTTDADILEFLDNLSMPKAKYIKQLIREDMKRYN